jgi:hypothetical protein
MLRAPGWSTNGEFHWGAQQMYLLVVTAEFRQRDARETFMIRAFNS